MLTISDGVAAGHAPGRSRALALAERARGARASGSTAPRCRTSECEIERAVRSAAATTLLVVTTGGTGLTPRDVTPQATLRRDRLRGARPGRGHSRRGPARRPRWPTCRAASSGVLGRYADRQRAGQPARRARDPSRPSSPRCGTPWRRSAAHSTTAPPAPASRASGPARSGLPRRRAHRGPATITATIATERDPLMFPFFEHVPLYPLVFAVFWGAALRVRARDGAPPARLRGGAGRGPQPVRQHPRAPRRA